MDLSKASYYLTDDRQARFAAAEAAFNKALSAAPDHAVAHALLGVTLSATHRASQGIAECERALSLNPNLAQAHAYIGYAKYLLGRGSETEPHITEALRLSPRDTFAYLWFLFAGTGKFQVEAYAEVEPSGSTGSKRTDNFPMSAFPLDVRIVFAREGLAVAPLLSWRTTRRDLGCCRSMRRHPPYVQGLRITMACHALSGNVEAAQKAGRGSLYVSATDRVSGKRKRSP